MESNGHYHIDPRSPSLAERNLLLATALNLFITLVQVIGGIFANSLALLSDALHNLTDSIGLILAYIARRMNRRLADERRTFGYSRAEVIAALINALLLIGITFILVWEAIQRFNDPLPVKGLLLTIFAALGLLANLGGMLLLKQHNKESINIRAAYLHLLGDAMSSIAVMLAGLIIYYSSMNWVDPAITILISGYILWKAYPIFRESASILMQSSPKEIDIKRICQEIKQVDGIKDIHHLHMWQLNEFDIHLEAHIDLREDMLVGKTEAIHLQASNILKERFGIKHITLQMEYGFCDQKDIIYQSHKTT